MQYGGSGGERDAVLEQVGQSSREEGDTAIWITQDTEEEGFHLEERKLEDSAEHESESGWIGFNGAGWHAN